MNEIKLNFFKKAPNEKKASKVTQVIINQTGTSDVSALEKYETIAEEGYRQNATVYISVKRYVDAISGLTFEVQQDSEDGVEVVKDHPASSFLNGKPNVLQSKGEFWWEYLQYLFLGGEGFIEGNFVRNGTVIKEMYARRPDRIDIVPGNSVKPIANYTYNNGKPVYLKTEDVSFLKFPNPLDDWRGMSPFTAAGLNIDLNNMYKKYGISYIRNGAKPTGVLSTENELTEDEIELYKSELESKFQNETNTGRPLVLGGGLKWHQMGTTQSDMDFIEGQKLTKDEIAMVMSMPSVLLNKDATFENQKEAWKLFYNGGVFPLVLLINQELTEWFRLRGVINENQRISINRKNISILQEDTAELYKRAIEAFDKGLFTRNQAYSMIGMSTIKGQDVFKTKINEVYVDIDGEITQINQKEDEKKKLIFEKKELTENNIDDIASAIKADRIQKNTLVAYIELIQNEADDMLVQLGIDEAVDMRNASVRAYTTTETGTRIKFITETLRDKLSKQLQEGIEKGEGFNSLKARTDKVFQEQYFATSKSHLETIVRTETMDALTFANQEAYKQSGVVDKIEWVTTLDGRERPTHDELNGQVINLGDKFKIPSNGLEAERPHGFDEASENIQCYDKETEILTENGFKLFKDLEINEKVASLNPNTKEIEYVIPKTYIEYKYKGNMYSFKNQRTDIKVTNNHSMVVVKNEKIKLKRADEIKNKDLMMKSGAKWNGNIVESVKIGNKEYEAKSFSKFMAIYLADGSTTLLKTTKTKHRYQIAIHQNPGELKTDIENICTSIFERIWIGKNKVYIIDDNMAEYLYKLGKSYEKYIPKEIKERSKVCLDYFLKYYCLTDGTTVKARDRIINGKSHSFNKQRRFTTSSTRMADDLGEIILKTGNHPSFAFPTEKDYKEVKFSNGVYKIKHPVILITECTTEHYNHINKYLTVEKYNDMVFCVELKKNHIIYVRRNGKCIWSGNCRCITVASLEELTEEKKLELWTKADNTAVSYEAMFKKVYKSAFETEKKAFDKALINKSKRG